MSEIIPITINTIGIIGGTGKEGKGLAYRWAKAGYKILIGSRDPKKAEAAAENLKGILSPEYCIEGVANAEAASFSDIVVLTVPYSAHIETLAALKAELAGKILIDVTVPIVPPKVTRVQMPPEGSAAQQAQAILGPQTRVACAFQNISYEHLMSDEAIECDVLVCGNGKFVRDIVIDLVRKAGLVAWDAGPLDNAVVVEGLTSILIGINRQFGCDSAGIKITGV